MSWTETETVRRWLAGDRGRDQCWTLQALIKRHIGEDGVPLDEFAQVLGLPRELVVTYATRAHADTLRAAGDARQYVELAHEAWWLKQRAANLRVICGLP